MRLHEVAEDMEHISSKKLIDKLDEFWVFQNLTLMATQFLMRMENWKQEKNLC
jgi:hypothetical protein